jgi:chromosomal replication initiation ATPase DnaA
MTIDRSRSCGDIIRALVSVSGVALDRMQSRSSENVRLRCAYYVVASERGMSISRISQAIGRDHTTVLSSLRKHSKHRDVVAMAEELRQRLLLPTWRERLRDHVREHGVSAHVR